MRMASIRILNFAEREGAALGPKAHRNPGKRKVVRKLISIPNLLIALTIPRVGFLIVFSKAT
jgi:hypothetical protein